MPKVTILLATFNGERYLKDQLNSILNQTFEDFVCYIHDDGSTDKTKLILKEYENISSKIKILDYPSCGSAKLNFMSLLNYVDTPYVMFCDQDDVWISNKIEKCYKYINSIVVNNKNKNVLVFSDLKIVNENLEILSNSYEKYENIVVENNISLNKVIVRNVTCGNTMIMTKELCDIIRKCKHPEKIVMHDYWFMLVACTIGEVKYIREPLVLYRQHNQNVCGAHSSNKKKWDKSISNYFIELRKLGFQQFIAAKKNWIKMCREQALELAELDELPYEYKKLCNEFGRLNKKCKIRRLIFYKKNNIKRDNDNYRLIIWG